MQRTKGSRPQRQRQAERSPWTQVSTDAGRDVTDVENKEIGANGNGRFTVLRTDTCRNGCRVEPREL